MYCNRKVIIARGLQNAHRQRHNEKCKSLFIDKRHCEIRRSESTHDSVATQNGVDDITIEIY